MGGMASFPLLFRFPRIRPFLRSACGPDDPLRGMVRGIGAGLNRWPTARGLTATRFPAESLGMTPAPELAIRLRRAAFNRALAEGDLHAIGPLLAVEAVLVAGTDSAILSGRKAQLIAWKREFAAADRTVYTRTPGTIVASPIAPIAMEHGQWEGISVGTGESLASGSYTAKWRQIGGEWVIEAEIYLTLA